MGGLSWWHWLIIIAAFILIFGAKKLPETARGLGRSLRILKSEVAAMHDDPTGSEPTMTHAPTHGSPTTPPIRSAAPNTPHAA